ncbi:ThiF family adenylyltransferase [Leifsonia xyli]|uniref:ThiF family adenylyltransferase n=1 Tax=Leifsonia xyli TaxID=1575 RepID=UPI003D664486
MQRLQDEGYGAQLRAGHLLVSTPYVNAQREVKWGYLISTIEVIDLPSRPDIHVAYFLGETVDDYPCNSDGARLDNLIHQPGPIDLGQGLVVTCGFSQRPATPRSDYENYYDKMSTYVGMLQAHAQAIDGTISYRQYPPIVATPEESVFQYEDAATTHARIGAVVDKIRGQRIAIVGLGGSGSYVLDAVAKTPVGAIHLFDDDLLLIHNAFRSPGAATLDELNGRPKKVAHHAATYTGMHRHVIPHPVRVTADNIQELTNFDFVFISVDAGPDKRDIFKTLRSANIPFVDTGMGIYQRGSSIGGVVRTSTSLPTQVDPNWIIADGEISFVDDGDDGYAQNIQIAELNMLNAALAVIKWKQYFGFYFDLETEYTSNYTIDGNHMLNRGATA